jgi:ABC-2 type transport system ATP-binding protein
VTLRATALSVTGPARQAATFAAAHQLLQTESMADRSRATVETTSIQQLVVAMRRATTPPAATAPKQPSDLQGVSR